MRNKMVLKLEIIFFLFNFNFKFIVQEFPTTLRWRDSIFILLEEH